MSVDGRYARLLRMSEEGDAAAAGELAIEAARRGDRWGEMVSRLAAGPSEAAWRAIAEVLPAWVGREEQAKVWALAERRLSAWPDRLRAAPASWWRAARWLEAESGADTSLLELARGASWRGRELRGREGARALCVTRGVERWTWLELEAVGLGEGLAEALEGAPLFALERLWLSDHDLSPSGLGALLRGRSLARVRALALVGGPALSRAHLEVLLGAPCRESWEALTLEVERVEVLVEVLRDVGDFHHLKRLRVVGNFPLEHVDMLKEVAGLRGVVVGG